MAERKCRYIYIYIYISCRYIKINIYQNINVPNLDIFTSKDASLCDWGAVMESQSTKDLFSTSEKKEHTNMLELKAILFGLKALTKGFTKPH